MTEIAYEIQPIYPGGELGFDMNRKVLIEFSHFDGFQLTDFKNASLMALEEIGFQQILPKNFQLKPYFFASWDPNLLDEFLNEMLNPLSLKGNLIALYGL